MKFTISKRNFAKHIGQVLKGIPTKSNNPILKNFLIEARQEESKVYVTSTDMTICIQSQTDATIIESGVVCVDGKLLDGLLKTVKLKSKQDKELTFYLEGDEMVVEIDSSITKFKTDNTNDFPCWNWNDGFTTLSINGDDLLQSIKQVTFSTVKNESRPILSGILFEADELFLTMVSTDGHRMSLKRLQIEEVKRDINVIIPVDSLLSVAKILSSNKKCTMNISISENDATFETNGVRISTSFITGQFLNYKQIFNIKKSVTRFGIDKKPLLAVLERASILIPKAKIALVNLNAEDDLLNISIASDKGNIEEIIDINMIGESLKISFNLSYLISALQAIKEDRLTFHFINETNPVILEGSGNKSYQHMLLPIKSYE